MRFDRFFIVMPTRGRPGSAKAAAESVWDTAQYPDRVRIVACQDEDDAAEIDCVPLRIMRLPRMRFIAWVNRAVEMFGGHYDWLAWLGDDIRYKTSRWDELVCDHKTLVVYGRDGYQDQKMATHPFIRTVVPRALGYLLPKELVHGCADTFIEALAREIGSIDYDPRIFTEHLHPAANKAEVDQTYRDAADHWPNDIETMENYIKPRIPELAAIVKGKMYDL